MDINTAETSTTGRRRTSLSILSVAAAAVLALSACAPDDSEETTVDDGSAEELEGNGTDDADSAEDPADEAEETDTEDDPATEDDAAAEDDAADADSAGDHPVYQAIEAVLAEYDGGVITEFDDNTNDDGYVEVYVYDGETEWELEVDSETFQIIDTEDDGIDEDDRQEAEAVEIDIVEALQTAESEGGGEPEEGELETEDGTVVWQFELTNDVDVSIDVTNGEVTEVDQ